MSTRSARILACAVFLVVCSGVSPVGRIGCMTAYAQNLGQRVVSGTVVDDTSTAVQGATVFLKNLKTKAIRSYSSDPKGHFRFTQVDMAQNHEIWAEKEGHKSPVKTVSEWDARKEFETELKLK